ncbi:hypothetical protein [Tahibacter harae]|uniref:Uncharacterized protein n=1 Tax=Tahibacter harae TaxID=2963937 RepID=A0ABT1QU37_9GAMM|nr:hypothetical protein [Tahibacter harae]MCQ4165786.1 hypothetical protein [Tahibacter harae]
MRLSPRFAPPGTVFAAVQISDADFDGAAGRLRAEVFGLDARVGSAEVGRLAAAQ